jgi:hypothetical protein
LEKQSHPLDGPTRAAHAKVAPVVEITSDELLAQESIPRPVVAQPVPEKKPRKPRAKKEQPSEASAEWPFGTATAITPTKKPRKPRAKKTS